MRGATSAPDRGDTPPGHTWLVGDLPDRRGGADRPPEKVNRLVTTKTKPRWEPSGLLETALRVAVERHADHGRKIHEDPYLGHLLGVASTVIEYGGDEEQVCAALLHDAIEDTQMHPDEIVAAFGPGAGERIAAMVQACSDSDGNVPKDIQRKEWAIRKDKYHQDLSAKKNLPDESSERRAVLVSICDKIDNCAKSARDRRRMGTTEFWEGFNAGDSCQKWNYEQLLEAYREALPASDRRDAVLDRFAHAIDDLFGRRNIETCEVIHGHAPGGAR